MSREFKFRAWHRKLEQMLTVEYIDLKGKWIGVAEDIGRMAYDYDPGEPSHACDLKEAVLMQSTGLRDQNGKEIFEGDIVRVESKSYGVYAVPIQYIPGRAMFCGVNWLPTHRPKQIEMPLRSWDKEHDPCGCDGAMYEAMHCLDTLKTDGSEQAKVVVLGNLYEHPSLLSPVPQGE